MAADRHQSDGDAERLIGRLLCRKWRVERLIGVGGMSSVYAATHKNGKRVAVKVLHPHLAGTPRARKRFLREGFLANNVDHLGAVSVLDEDVDDDGTVFLVMELLEGETLEKAWQRAHRRMPVRRALDIVDAVLDVLARAHEKGVVHRDLKPANVFLTASGGVKVLDFGIASLQQPSSSDVTTRSGGLLGTPAFMAREQARGRWDLVDARTDVWSVGAILFTLLSGRTVYEGETSNEVLIACATQPPPPLASVADDVPPVVAEFVDRALSVDKAARWEDASRMQAAIRRVLESDDCRNAARPVIGRAVDTPMTLSETGVPSVIERFVDTGPAERARSTTMRRAGLLLVVAAGAAALALMLRSRPAHLAEPDSSVMPSPPDAMASEPIGVAAGPGPTTTLEPGSGALVTGSLEAVGAPGNPAPTPPRMVGSASVASKAGAPSKSQARPTQSAAAATPERIDDLEDPLLDRRK
jgi:serine/threonine-protein kinase